MTWLYESPLTILAVGAMFVSLFGVLWFQTGEKVFVWLTAGVLMLTGLAGYLERTIVTDREQVERTVEELRAALLTNDLKQIEKHLAPQSAPELSSEAAQALQHFRLTKATVSDLMVKVPLAADKPNAADARFSAVIGGTAKGAEFANASGIYEQRFVLHFERSAPDAPWLVVGYERSDMGGGTSPLPVP